MDSSKLIPFMLKHDRGEGKERIANIEIGTRVYNRYHGNGTVVNFNGDEVYVKMDESKKVFIFDKKYLWKEM